VFFFFFQVSLETNPNYAWYIIKKYYKHKLQNGCYIFVFVGVTNFTHSGGQHISDC
jgi:hypothetical protein